MQVDKAIEALAQLADHYSPKPEDHEHQVAVVGMPTKKVAYSALRQGIAALQSNQEAVDISDLIQRQRVLMKMLGMPVNASKDILDDPGYKDVLIMMGGEVHEALEPLLRSTKPWKNQNLDDRREHAREELIDVFFFFLEACVFNGFTGKDIEERYEAKRQKNIARLKAATTSAELPKFIVGGTQEPEPDPDKEHEHLLAACQRAAGLFSSMKARSFMWKKVWEAEGVLETLRREPTIVTKRPYTILLEAIRDVKPLLDGGDRLTLASELLKELGVGLQALVLEKAGYHA